MFRKIEKIKTVSEDSLAVFEIYLRSSPNVANSNLYIASAPLVKSLRRSGLLLISSGIEGIREARRSCKFIKASQKSHKNELIQDIITQIMKISSYYINVK